MIAMAIPINAQNGNKPAPSKVSSGKGTVQPKANDADLAHVKASPEYKALVTILSKNKFLETLAVGALKEITNIANALATLNSKANIFKKGHAGIILGSAATVLYMEKKSQFNSFIVTIHNNIQRSLKKLTVSTSTAAALETIMAKLKQMGTDLKGIDNLGKLLTDSNHIKNTIQSFINQLIVISTII